ncbi:unnamed protein product [Adineta ricciae]|uniref:Uncharacterized protein n=1 Tax=Adineta ricciae TaxID=249248 RepID=A0A813WX95_ADIRI|nr:unnamed protein product [Adineta ricciae]CAF1187218.1 unnamed protein product [Adineta ricciae]
MAAQNNTDAFKGAWDFVDGDDSDEYLKELGVGKMGRMMAKTVKPRLVISESDGKWSLRTETTLKTMTIEFTPNVEYEEVTGDGRHLTGTIRFENGKWIQNMVDKNGKPSSTTRWVDDKDQLQTIAECGHAKVHKYYKRVK